DMWELQWLGATSGTMPHPTATVKMTFKDQEFPDAAMGDGPVDAAFAAIDRITANPLTVHKYDLEAVTEGQDALGRVTLTVSRQDGDHSLRVKGRGVATDIVLASAKAYVNALNALDRLERAGSGETEKRIRSTAP